MCAYPTSSGTSYDVCLGLVDDLPDFGSVDGREFAVELDYYDIPEEALTPSGEAEGLDMPFPEEVGGTIFRIAGVDPGGAVLQQERDPRVTYVVKKCEWGLSRAVPVRS